MKYRVDLKEFGEATVDAPTRFDAVREAAIKLGCTDVGLAFLATLASVRVLNAKSAGRPKSF